MTKAKCKHRCVQMRVVEVGNIADTVEKVFFTRIDSRLCS